MNSDSLLLNSSKILGDQVVHFMQNLNITKNILKFYNAYRNSGHSPGLILMAVLIACCAIPGNLMNIFLVYLTVKHK